MESLEIGGVIAIAFALVEVLKILILRLLDKREGSQQTLDGFAKEVAWRTRVGDIVKEQHETQKQLVNMIERHDEDAKRARSQLDQVGEQVDEIHEEVVP